jgi:hypothetical protein
MGFPGDNGTTLSASDLYRTPETGPAKRQAYVKE